MRIAIPTRGRVNDQQTLVSIPPDLHDQVVVFSPVSEVEALQANWPRVLIVGQPEEVQNIGQKRHYILQWMQERGENKVLMLDDDLFFYARYINDNGDPRLLDATAEQTIEWFGKIEDQLTPEAPHAGFGPRQGNQNFPSGWLEGGRVMLALGYYVPTVLEQAEHARIGTREDMDLCLQLLRKGLPNHVTHEFCVGQKSYAAPGGMTGERTTESSDADAERLAQFHPGFVKVVEKPYKGHPRKEVIVQWKRALAAGRARPQPV